MVELSLAHRVKMDKRAPVVDEDEVSEHEGIVQGGFVWLALLSISYLFIGIMLAATMDYAWDGADGSRPAEWYEQGSEAEHRANLFFFYCTIAFVLTILSIYDSVHARRHHSKTSPTLVVASASIGLGLWLVQFSLSGSCIWLPASSSNAFCPFAAIGSHPTSFPSTGLKLAWGVPWIGLVAIVSYATYLVTAILKFHNRGKASRKSQQAQRSYSYRGVDRPEVQTDRDMPELDVTDADGSRCRSYQQHSESHEGMPAEREKEMV